MELTIINCIIIVVSIITILPSVHMLILLLVDEIKHIITI